MTLNDPSESSRLLVAKTRGLKAATGRIVANPRRLYLDPETVMGLFERYESVRDGLKTAMPDLLGDLQVRQLPRSSGTTDHDGRGYIERQHVQLLDDDLQYILDCVDAVSPFPAGPPIAESVEPPQAFLLMPFAEEFEWLHDEIVSAGADSGINVTRADDISESGAVLKQVKRAILDADVVVAVCTGKNANVFFELGIAESSHSPILVASDDDDLPFDVGHRRAVFYGGSGPKKSRSTFHKRICSALSATLEARARTSNDLHATSTNAKSKELSDLLGELEREIRDPDSKTRGPRVGVVQKRLRVALAGLEGRLPVCSSLCSGDVSPGGVKVMMTDLSRAFDEITAFASETAS